MVALSRHLPLRVTRHASLRCQQRSVPAGAIETIVRFGTRYHAGAGMKAYYLGKRAIATARTHYGVDLSLWRDTAVIIAADRAVVTVQYVDRPKRSWRGRN